MPPTEIRPARVRAFRLAAQHLTDAAPAPTLAAAAAVCGLPDAPPGSAALGLAARVPGIMPPDVRRALAEDRSLVVALGRRGAPQLVPSAELGIFTRGLLPDDEESWQAVVPGALRHLSSADMSAEELVRLVTDAALEVLDGAELTRRELGEALRPKMPATMRARLEEEALASLIAVLVRGAGLFGGFVLVDRDEGEPAFVRADRLLGAFPADDPATARREMTRRYLRAYGPSSPRAYAEWAGVGEAFARRAFEAIADEVVGVRVEGADGFLLAEDAERIAEVPDAEGVRLLPPHDAYLASVDRRVVVPETGRHKGIWKAAGEPGGVLLKDEIAGVWRARKSGRRLAVEVFQFRTLPNAAKDRVQVLAARVAAFKGADVATVDFRQ